MKSNIFFKKKNINLNKIFPKHKIKQNFVIDSIRPLIFAKKNDISFFDSIKYKDDIVTIPKLLKNSRHFRILFRTIFKNSIKHQFIVFLVP